MMLAAEVYDVSPSSTAVGTLHANGVDPWVVDFGAPEREEGGLERNLTDHVLAVSDAVDRVREVTGRDVHLGGYSQGGMFCYQAAALRRGEGTRERDHLRQPGRHRGGHAARHPRGGRLPAGRRAGRLHARPQRRARVDVAPRLPDARPGEGRAPAGRLRPPAPRPRGAAAARAPAPVPPGRGLGRLARPRARRLHAAVRRPQPHARGRLRDRRPPGDAGRHRLPDPDRRRRGRRARPRPRGARDRPRRAARRDLRARAPRRALRPGRRLGVERHDLAHGRRAGRAGATRARSCRRRSAAPRSPPSWTSVPAPGARAGYGLGLAAGVGSNLARSVVVRRRPNRLARCAPSARRRSARSRA